MTKRVAPDSLAYPLPFPMEIMLKIFGYVSLTTKQILELKTISRLFVAAINVDFIGAMAQKYNGIKENWALFSKLHGFLDSEDKTRRAFAESVIKHFSTSAGLEQIAGIIPDVTPHKFREYSEGLQEKETRNERVSEEMLRILSAHQISKMMLHDYLRIEKVIKYFSGLKELVWRATNMVEDYVHLSKLTSLEVLSIEAPPNPPHLGYASIVLSCTNLTHLTKLTVLDLQTSSGSELAQLTRLTNLAHLVWGRTFDQPRHFDDPLYPNLESKHLAPFTNLRRLTLVGSSITYDASIQPLQGTTLTRLDLLDCRRITREDVENLDDVLPDADICRIDGRNDRYLTLAYLLFRQR